VDNRGIRIYRITSEYIQTKSMGVAVIKRGETVDLIGRNYCRVALEHNTISTWKKKHDS